MDSLKIPIRTNVRFPILLCICSESMCPRNQGRLPLPWRTLVSYLAAVGSNGITLASNQRDPTRFMPQGLPKISQFASAVRRAWRGPSQAEPPFRPHKRPARCLPAAADSARE
jgi:hypothetical protein